jgi:hypothetical protein
MEKVIRVIPHPNYTLELWFDTGDHRLFDVTAYLNRGVFQRLQDVSLFLKARAALGTVVWPGEIDLAPETLYDLSVPIDEPSGQRVSA